MTYIDLVIALVEGVVAGLLFYQALVAIDQRGGWCALRHWLLAMSIGLLGVGRFTSFINAQEPQLLAYTLGHLCLIAFGLAFLNSSRRRHGTVKDMYERRRTERTLHAKGNDALAKRAASWNK